MILASERDCERVSERANDRTVNRQRETETLFHGSCHSEAWTCAQYRRTESETFEQPAVVATSPATGPNAVQAPTGEVSPRRPAHMWRVVCTYIQPKGGGEPLLGVYLAVADHAHRLRFGWFKTLELKVGSPALAAFVSSLYFGLRLVPLRSRGCWLGLALRDAHVPRRSCRFCTRPSQARASTNAGARPTASARCGRASGSTPTALTEARARWPSWRA